MAALKRTKNLTWLAPKYRPQVNCRRQLNLQEYHSKDLLRKHQVTIQNFRLLDSNLDPKCLSDFKANEYVVKAQILAGGRGKGHFDNGFKGGVHLTKNRNEIMDLAENMIGHKLITKQTPKEGILVDKVMVAESVNIVRETYFSIVMERSYNGAALVASPAGGMDIETVAEKTPHLLKTVPIDIYEGITDNVAKEVAEFLEFKGPLVNKCAEEIKKLWQLFLKVDATQLEINPLVETDDGRVVAVDAKINFDDNAQFRQKDIFALDDPTGTDPREREAAALNLSFIDMDGSIGCMVNGAGLAMATMDLIVLSGGKPANFLDLGGGVGKAQVSAALRLLESDPKVKTIFVNVFGGIINCAMIAEGIVAACKEQPPKNPLVIRLEGTNSGPAKKILEQSGLPFTIINDADEAGKGGVERSARTDGHRTHRAKRPQRKLQCLHDRLTELIKHAAPHHTAWCRPRYSDNLHSQTAKRHTVTRCTTIHYRTDQHKQHVTIFSGKQTPFRSTALIYCPNPTHNPPIVAVPVCGTTFRGSQERPAPSPGCIHPTTMNSKMHFKTISDKITLERHLEGTSQHRTRINSRHPPQDNGLPAKGLGPPCTLDEETGFIRGKINRGPLSCQYDKLSS